MTDGDPVGEETVINAVQLVRRIRDHHAIQLQGKTPAEVRAFFQSEAAAVNAKVQLLPQDRQAESGQTDEQPEHEGPHAAR